MPITYNQRAVTQSRNIETRISHRELLTTVTGGGFTTGQYKIQPGLSLTFPWLSGIAPGYENYQIMNLRFEYISRCSTLEAGMLYMTIDYDAGDIVNITDEMTLSQYAGTVTQRVYQNTNLNFNLGRQRKIGKLYTRFGSIPNNAAIQDYDAGTFVYAIAGSAANVLGSIYISYDIRFTVPQPFENDTILARSARVTQALTYPSSLTNINTYQLAAAFSGYQSITEGNGPIQLDEDQVAFVNTTGEFAEQIWNFQAQIAGDVAEAVIDSIISVLSPTTYMSVQYIYDLATGAIAGILPFQKSGGGASDWIISCAVRFATNAVGQKFKLATGAHSALAGNKLEYLSQFLSPFLL